MVHMSQADGKPIEFRLAPEPLRLRCWPIRDEPVSTLAAVLASVLLCGLVAQQTDWRFAALLAVAQLVVLWRRLAPTTYEMNASGVIVRRVRGKVLPWNRIAKAEFGRHGVLLLPVRNDSPWSRLRGIYIPWRSSETAVRGMLAFYLAPRPANADSSPGARPARGNPTSATLPPRT